MYDTASNKPADKTSGKSPTSYKKSPVTIKRDSHAANSSKNNNVNPIYDEVVKQLNTGESQSMIPCVKPNALKRVKTTKVPRVYAYAVCVLPSLLQSPSPAKKDAPAPGQV